MKFDAAKEFFLIESTELGSLKSVFYGYAVTENGIINKKAISDLERSSLCGCGCYVDIRVSEGKVRIDRDADGCYGLFVYRGENGYFAISNSFFWLLENVKEKHAVTLNRDYVNTFLVLGPWSYAWSETPISEIRILNKSISLEVDIATGRLEEKYVATDECSLDLNSAEGMQNLDRWYEKWMRIYRQLYATTKNITVGLSGGMDSRLTFMLAMNSGMDLNEISVYSAYGVPDKWGKATFAEDYEIASDIARRFGFVLNSNLDRAAPADDYDQYDVQCIERYVKGGFHKEPYYTCKRYRAPRYLLPGVGGECLRPYYNVSSDKFLALQEYLSTLRLLPRKALSESIRHVVGHGIDEVSRRHGILKDDHTDSLSTWYYRDVSDTFHTGRYVLGRYFANEFTLLPQHDPLVMRMKWHDNECMDNNLLISVIFTRYRGELLDFRFDSGRSIDAATIEHARMLNEKYPLRGAVSGRINYKRNLAGNLSSAHRQVVLSSQDSDKVSAIDSACAKVFVSRTFRKRAIRALGTDAYYFALFRLKTSKNRPMSECYAVLDLMHVVDEAEACARALASSSPLLSRRAENSVYAHSEIFWGGGGGFCAKYV